MNFVDPATGVCDMILYDERTAGKDVSTCTYIIVYNSIIRGGLFQTRKIKAAYQNETTSMF